MLFLAVDGELLQGEQTRRLRLHPGFHLLQIATTRPSRARELMYRPFAIEAAACTRYEFAAKHHSRTSRNAWNVVVTEASASESCRETLGK